MFTYRYFLHRFPQLCILAVPTDGEDDGGGGDDGAKRRRRPIGCVVCKIDIDDDASDDGVVANAAEEEDAANDGGAGEGEVGSAAESLQIARSSSHDKSYSGYIGMLAVEKTHRRSGIGTALVQRAIHRMKEMGCKSVRLETEVTNESAVRLYEDRLGFIREELLKKYYLNWGDAYRLRLWLDG